MFAAPGEQQLNPTLFRLWSKIEGNPLFRILKASSNKNEGILKWHTNVIWHFRIDGTVGDDRNMVGLRLDEIIFDEASFTVRVCHSSRKQSALPGCMWLYAGVPNSVRHTPFWELDQTKDGLGWSHHKTSTFMNPLYWDVKRRDTLIQDYGGRDNPDYTTQVMGAWGVELFSSFPPEQMAIDETLPYRVVNLGPRDIPESYEADALSLTRLAGKVSIPRVKAVQYILGMDYGFHQDPTELGVAYRESMETQDWKMLLRIHVVGVDPLAQARLVYHLVSFLGGEKVVRAGIDLEHAGLAVGTALSERGEYWQALIVNLKSGGTVELPDPLDQTKKIKVRRKQWITQELQAALLAAKLNLDGHWRLTLARDPELTQELMDTREHKMPSGYVVYVPRSLGNRRVVDHATDMLRGLAVAATEAANAETLGGEDDTEIGAWAANPFQSTWRAPFGSANFAPRIGRPLV